MPELSIGCISVTGMVSGNSLVLVCPSESSYVTLSVVFSSPDACGVKAYPIVPVAPEATLPTYWVFIVASKPSPSIVASTLAISPLPLFTYSIVTVFSWPAITWSGTTGSLISNRSGWLIGTEILTSDWLEERAPASTYSYRKFTVTGCAPLFAEASACMGTVCVIAYPAHSAST